MRSTINVFIANIWNDKVTLRPGPTTSHKRPWFKTWWSKKLQRLITLCHRSLPASGHGYILIEGLSLQSIIKTDRSYGGRDLQSLVSNKTKDSPDCKGGQGWTKLVEGEKILVIDTAMGNFFTERAEGNNIHHNFLEETRRAPWKKNSEFCPNCRIPAACSLHKKKFNA